MVASLDHGRRAWSMDRDDYGYRSYTLVNVVTAHVLDGPLTVLSCPGLPRPYSLWNFGTDFDVWCWCHHQAKVTPLNQGEQNTEWEVEQVFSNRPVNICGEMIQLNPLLQPQKVSGSLCKYTEEASYDRHFLPIVNSAWEQIRGPGVQFDVNRATVRVEQNVPQLQLALLNNANNTVNDRPLWGLPARCIKLSNVSWQKNFTGHCVTYYTRTLEFDINVVLDPILLIPVSGFDRNLLDEGNKVMFGQWDAISGDYILKKILGVFNPDPFNPAHFIVHKDRTGATVPVVLNGAGLPAGVRIRAGPSLYISRTATHTAYDTGDKEKWVRLVTNPANRPLWAKKPAGWGFGSLVNYRDSAGVIKIYLCIDEKGTKLDPSSSSVSLGFGWQLIGSVTAIGADASYPDYSATATYAEGSVVQLVADIGPYYMSIVAAQQHAANDLLKKKKWLKLVTSPTVIPPYSKDQVATYPAGSLVKGSDTKIYCATNLTGATGDPTIQFNRTAYWLEIPVLTDQGLYNGTANYGLGDYVSPSRTVPGRIHVEKYHESNLLLLGIPTTL